jgi:hypothetical protein
MRIDVATRFTRDCHELGITIHGTFILGLPGETKETIEETIRFATGDQPAHHPGVARRALSGDVPHKQAMEKRLASIANQPSCRPIAARRSRAQLSASQPYRDLPVGRRLLQRFYFRARQDRLDRGRDGHEPGNDEARACARALEFFRFPARAPGAGALKHDGL